jgi:hypothetical protein
VSNQVVALRFGSLEVSSRILACLWRHLYKLDETSNWKINSAACIYGIVYFSLLSCHFITSHCILRPSQLGFRGFSDSSHTVPGFLHFGQVNTGQIVSKFTIFHLASVASVDINAVKVTVANIRTDVCGSNLWFLVCSLCWLQWYGYLKWIWGMKYDTWTPSEKRGGGGTSGSGRNYGRMECDVRDLGPEVGRDQMSMNGTLWWKWPEGKHIDGCYLMRFELQS